MDFLDASFIDWGLGAGGGSVLTLLINKIVNLKRDKAQLKAEHQKIAVSQESYLTQINARLNETVEKLQKLACYVPTCDFRINGVQTDTTDSKQPKQPKRAKKQGKTG